MKRYILLFFGLVFLTLMMLGIIIPWLISNKDFSMPVNTLLICIILMIYMFIAEGIGMFIKKKCDAIEAKKQQKLFNERGDDD